MHPIDMHTSMLNLDMHTIIDDVIGAALLQGACRGGGWTTVDTGDDTFSVRLASDGHWVILRHAAHDADGAAPAARIL